MASKNTYQVQPQAALTDDEFFARLDAVAGVKQEAAEKPKESAGVLRTAGDLGLKAAQGVVGLGQAAIGLGNLATGGLVGKGMRRAGYDPERTNQAIGEYLSDSQKESDRKVQEADGFLGTAQAMLENPRSIIGGAAQSAPGMLLGGGMTSAVARRIGAAAAAPLGGLQTPAGQAAAKAAVEKAAGRLMLTGSSAEGVQAAGQIAEKAEREGRGWGDYVLPSVGAGIGTAAIGRATGKLMGDSETAIFSGAKSAAAKGSLPVRVVKSGASEGIEETLQSGQQQSMENIALGKEWDDEIDKAMGQGLVVGSAMGLGTGAFTRADNARQQQAVASAQQSGGIVSRAGLAATPGAQQPNPVAPNPAAPQPTAAVAPGAAGQPAAGTAAGAASPTQPAQTPIQASALSAIEQALEADKQRRRTAGEVVEDEVEEGDVVAAGNPAAVDPPDAAPSPAMQAQPAQTTQPASAGFSSPKFDNSPIPKMEPAEAAEQRRQATEAQDRRRKRVAALRLGAYNKNPMMEFLGRHGLQPEEQNEFAPGNTERRKAAVYGYGPVFRKNGKPLDLLLANAQDEGFLPPDSSESDLRDLVSRTINGERVEPLYKAGIADDLMQRLAAEREAKEAASYEDYLREHGQAVESGDFDPLDSIGATGYDFGDDDLADYAAATPTLQAEVSALAQHYYDLGFDPDEVLERLSIETENQPEQAYYDLAKSRFTQLIEQALSPGRREGSTEQGGGGAVRRDAGQASAAQADGSAAGGQGQTAAVTPPAAPAVAQPRRADAIRAKLDNLKAQGFSQFTRSSGRTLLLNPDTYETVELTPAEMAVARTASSQARAGLQSLRGQRKPAQVDQQAADVLQSYSPADVLAQEEQVGQQRAAEQTELDKAQAQARADDERKRIEQASYAAAGSFELGQNPLDSLTGQKDIFGAAPVAQGLAGERINDEWTAFDPQSGTLGIPRTEMPQIKAEHRGAMVNFLKARGIDGQQETIPSAAIKPTQAEFSPAKVKKALDREGGSRSIIVSADGYVVDGHHQWLAAREKGEPIPAIRLDQNVGDVLAALKDMPSAQPEPVSQKDAARDYESDMRLYPGRVLEQVGANGELAKLYAKAGARGADAFGNLSADDQAAAYVAFVADGGKPADSLPQNYNDGVMEEERQIRRRQLQDERTINQANGKPFKTEAGAKAMLDEFDLGGTHKIVSEGGGYALRQMPPAEQAEVRRKADGRESYMEAQAAVITEMGIPSTADGEIDATDEQWDEIDQRIAERLGQAQTDAAKPAASEQPAVQPNAGPQSDDPIASRPFATVIEKTKTGWKIVGDPDALAEHARDIFGKGVVKRKDGISLATKTDDVAGNFPARFDEYRLADLPERHGRIEVRVNQDGSASVRSLDGGYMGPQLPSVAEAIANHRKEFGDGDSGVKQADAQPASSTAAANEEAQLKTVRDVADKLGMEYVSGLLANSLKKGQTFSLQGKQHTVTAVTDSRIRLKSSDGKTIEALKYGNKLVSSGNAKSQPYAQFVRDLEGVISVDLINESNPFHRPSEVFVLAQKALDALPADMKAARPESAAGAGNAAQAETGRDGYDTPIELDAAQLKAILEQSRGEPLVDKPAKLEAWRNGTAKTDPAKFPIELVLRPDGKLDVNDGRHRIALAAERGEKVTAFIDGKDAQRARDLLAMREQQAAGNAPSTAGVATSGAVNADLEAIFDQLDGITQRTQSSGQQAAAAHPQAERIQFVQKHILDILEDLEDSGKVTINC